MTGLDSLCSMIKELVITVRDWTDPKKKMDAYRLHIQKKAFKDILEAKKLILHVDEFWSFVFNKMAVKEERDKSKIKWYFSIYKRLKERFLL